MAAVWMPVEMIPQGRWLPPVRKMPNAVGLWRGNAQPNCAACGGEGVRDIFATGALVSMCDCVARNVFRRCLGRYRDIEERSASAGVNWARFGGGRPGGTGRAFARPGEDYRADFYLIARRYLRAAEWELFQLHMLEGRPWRECAAKVRMSRGNLFHSIYRIERNLGRIYLTLKPYALFPLDEYFASAVRRQQ